MEKLPVVPDRVIVPCGPECRVYRPISTMPQCLKCHGPLEELQPEIRAFLAQHYPGDNATSYSVYQWRGVIRVSLAAAEPATSGRNK